MSLLINGMDMPKHSGKSNIPELYGLTIKVYPDGEVRFYRKGSYEYYNVVDIPAPHGRLIDADDIDNITVVCTDRGTVKRIDAPTIIEAEE